MPDWRDRLDMEALRNFAQRAYPVVRPFAPAFAITMAVIALPLALRNGLPTEPVEFTFARWLGVLIPLLGAAALLASRASARSKGTFS